MEVEQAIRAECKQPLVESDLLALGVWESRLGMTEEGGWNSSRNSSTCSSNSITVVVITI